MSAQPNKLIGPQAIRTAYEERQGCECPPHVWARSEKGPAYCLRCGLED